MYLSIIVPAYNEEKRIPRTLRAIHSYMSKQDYDYEIIVANDGSKDHTKEVVLELTKEIPHLIFLDLPKNGGKGYAVQQGILSSKGDFCLFTDADNSTSIEQIEKLLPFIAQGYDIVVSSRHAPGANILIPQPKMRIILGTLFRTFVGILLPTGVYDTQNGFKLFTRPAAFTIFSQQRVFRWAFDVEVLSIAKKLGFNIKEVGITWKNDEASQMNFKGMVNSIWELFIVRKNLWTGTYYKPVNIPLHTTEVDPVLAK